MKKSDRTNNIKEFIYGIGAVIMLVSAAIYITGSEYIKYTYLAGSIIAGAMRFTSFVPSKNTILRRLRIQRIFASIAFILAGIFMFTNRAGNEWIAIFAIAAMLELYTAFRIPYVEKKYPNE